MKVLQLLSKRLQSPSPSKPREVIDLTGVDEDIEITSVDLAYEEWLLDGGLTDNVVPGISDNEAPDLTDEERLTDEDEDE